MLHPPLKLNSPGPPPVLELSSCVCGNRPKTRTQGVTPKVRYHEVDFTWLNTYTVHAENSAVGTATMSCCWPNEAGRNS